MTTKPAATRTTATLATAAVFAATALTTPDTAAAEAAVSSAAASRAAACSPATSVGSTTINRHTVLRTTKDTFAVTRLSGGRVKVAVRATLKHDLAVAVTVTADACPNGTSRPATVTTTTPWTGQTSKAARATRDGSTLTVAKKRARVAAVKTAIQAARNGATTQAIKTARAAAITAAITASNDTTQPPPAQTELEKFRTMIESETIRLANQERAKVAAQTLTPMKVLSDNARIWAQHMTDADDYQHSPPESQWPTALSSCTSAQAVAEIAAGPGFSDEQNKDSATATALANQVVQGWLDDYGHRHALLAAAASRVGVGVGITSNGDGNYRLSFVMHLFRGDCPQLP